QLSGSPNELNSASNDVLIAGLKIFKMNCAGCHGSRGQPRQWGLKISPQYVPQFADNSPHLYAPQMFVAIKQGIRYSGMGAWNGLMSDEEFGRWRPFSSKSGYFRLRSRRTGKQLNKLCRGQWS